MNFFFDTECCGYHGPIVLLQYAIDDGEIVLHEVWKEPIIATMALIEQMAQSTVIGFNLAFDWFHIQKFYNCLEELSKVVGPDEEPRDHINLFAELEPKARDGKCIKPVSALDLMLFARKGPFQSTMDRRPIVIKRVPGVLVNQLIESLEQRVHLDDIYFSKKKNQERWSVTPSKNAPGFMDVVLRFSASAALKVLAKYALNVKNPILHGDTFPEPRPLEVPWAPYAKAISSADKGWECQIGDKLGFAWPRVIVDHYIHWGMDVRARQYATDDVDYTRQLYHYFGRPEAGDKDSLLACCVGSSRWRGLAIDVDYITKLRDEAVSIAQKAPKAPHHVKAYLMETMTATERIIFDTMGSTKRTVLEKIAQWPDSPTAARAKMALEARQSATKVALFNKLLQAGRLHPAASVIGSLSSRMAGRTEVGDGKKASNLNALGIQKNKVIRRGFPLAHGKLVLAGGDFSAFEISIADAVYNDPVLRRELCTCYHCKYVRTLAEIDEVYCPSCKYAVAKCSCGEQALFQPDGQGLCVCVSPKRASGVEDTLRKMHGLFAMELHPGLSYEDIYKTKGTDNDLYDQGKRGVFSQLYGGDDNTLVERLNVDPEQARQANNGFVTRYQGIGESKRKIYDDFCSMRQPGGIGKAVEWHEPKDSIATLTGFHRFFTLENKICKALYQLAERPPKSWASIQMTVRRRDRDQTVSGAVRSALFACAFNIQAQNMRAAGNHVIQGTGAEVCKELQSELWSYQPAGVAEWKIQPFNIHDELMCPMSPDMVPIVSKHVRDFVHRKRSLIPLLKIDWSDKLTTWADK